MQLRRLRMRFRRRLRSARKQTQELGKSLEHGTDQYLFKRFERLYSVRRFVIGWVGLFVLLISVVVGQNIVLSQHYQETAFVAGGIYNEGVRGRFTNANPMYATSDADVTVSKLLFASLLKIDKNGDLVGDLAESYAVDTRGTTYTVRLKPNLRWHDGRPLTSADVAFTYRAIQSPDAQSPLLSGWQGITVTATDPQTVTFKLPNALASFPTSLTNGIVPEHILGDIDMAGLRSAEFNTVKPVGAGPFQWQTIDVSGSTPATERQQIALLPFAGYHAGAPKLQKFVVQVFAEQESLLRAFADNSLKAASGVTQVPEGAETDPSVVQHNLPLRAATMVFFKTTSGVLAEKPVRQALVQASDVPELLRQLDYPAREVKSPFLQGQLGYDPSVVQLSYNFAAAQKTLQDAGWVPGKDGIRRKAGAPLTFTITASNTRDNRIVGRQLEQQWKKLGVNAQVQYLSSSEFQNALTYHTYEAIINGISIGTDPDVYVYWDSSQADVRAARRLNLSEYNNPAADAALEAGRTRNDAALRVIKYKPFLQVWQQDAPALGLYQPRALYLTRGIVDGLSDSSVNSSVDRLANVHNWQIRQTRVTTD
jgi:peptide/nickel transport system substrate-binding protein